MAYEKFKEVLTEEQYFTSFDNPSELTEEIKKTIYTKYLVKCAVFQRDKFNCQNELCVTPENGITLHHVKWQKNGGKDAQRNCLTLCTACHQSYHKGKREIKVFDRANLPAHFRGHTLKFEKEQEINWKEIRAQMKQLRKNLHHLHGLKLTAAQMTILMNFLYMPMEDWEE